MLFRSCYRGDNCQHSHETVTNEKDKKKIIDYWTALRAAKGDARARTPSPGRAAGTGGKATGKQSGQKSPNPCWFHVIGRCTAGKTCNFTHMTKEEAKNKGFKIPSDETLLAMKNNPAAATPAIIAMPIVTPVIINATRTVNFGCKAGAIVEVIKFQAVTIVSGTRAPDESLHEVAKDDLYTEEPSHDELVDMLTLLRQSFSREDAPPAVAADIDRKSTRLNSSHT